MGRCAENEGMEIAILIFIFVVGPLALRYGVDSR